MRIALDCIPCLFKQALTTIRKATDDEELHKKMLLLVSEKLSELIELPTPTHAGRIIHNLPKELANCYDPYYKEKVAHTEVALNWYHNLKQLVKNSRDALLTAIKVSVVGNVIDFGRGEEINIEEDVKNALKCDFKILHYDEFREALNEADEILYLADNAGETVFDRILIEEISKPVLYAVKGKPVLNDATLEDAKLAGLDKIAKIIISGSDAPGILLEYCTDEFRKLFMDRKLIISKGQGNYEALSEIRKANLFFLLKIKCVPVAKHFGLNVDDMILMKSNA